MAHLPRFRLGRGMDPMRRKKAKRKKVPGPTKSKAAWEDLVYNCAAAMSFQFGLDAQRRESLGRGDADHSLVGRLTVGW